MKTIDKILIAVITAAIVCLCFFLFNQKNREKERSGEAPISTAEFSWNEIDFGTVNVDTMLVAECVIRNTGNQVLQIYDVNPDCSCTQLFWGKRSLHPGEETKVLLYVDTWGKYGDQQVNVLITTNTKEKHKLLKIHYRSDSIDSAPADDLRVGVDKIYIGEINKGQELKIKQYLFNKSDKDIIVESVTTSCACLNVVLYPKIIPAGNEGLIEISFMSESIGPFERDCYIKTLNKERVIEFSITGNVIENDDEVEVSEAEIVPIVKSVAENFADYYSRDYSAEYVFTKTVKEDGSYLEFVGNKGLILSLGFNQKYRPLQMEDENNMHQWYPFGIMRSKPWDIGGQGTLVGYSMPGYYQNIPNMPNSITDYKRTLEVFTPLNFSHIKDFSYTGTKKDGKLIVSFVSKDKMNLKKTRLIGSGRMVVDSSSNMVEHIEMSDHYDMWTRFPRVKHLMELATHHKVAVDYVIKGALLYTERIEVDIVWDQKDNLEGKYTFAGSPRINPGKYNISEKLVLSLSKQSDLSVEEKERFDLRMADTGFHTLFSRYIPSEWENFKKESGDWWKIESDLSSYGESLEDQFCRPMVLYEFLSEEGKDSSKEEARYLDYMDTIRREKKE